MKVFVFEGLTRECLAVVRSLGRYGIEVELGDCHRVNPTRFSKYVSNFYYYPDPKTREDDFTSWLLKHVKAHDYDMIFPLNDHIFNVCTKHQDELRRYTNLVVNDFGTFEMARDKRLTLKYAKKMGLPIPHTWFPDTEEDIQKILQKNPPFPLLLKPSKSSGSRGLKIIRRKEELLQDFISLRDEYGDMLLQDFIPGHEILDVPMIFNTKGEHRGSLVNNRIRMFPKEAGPNIAGHAIINEPLRQNSVELMKAINWKGVALAEFKMDPRDNTPKLMEINPRFWGTTQLGISSGIDWPRMLFQIAVEGDCQEVNTYRTDILMRWLIPGELLYLLSERNPRQLGWKFFKLWDRKNVDCIFSWQDIKPGFGLFLTILVKAVDYKMLKFMIFR